MTYVRYILQKGRAYLIYTRNRRILLYTKRVYCRTSLFNSTFMTRLYIICKSLPNNISRPTRLPFVLFFCAHNIKCLVRCLRSYFSTCPSCPTLATTYISNYCFMRSSMYCQQRYMAADLYITPMTCCCNLQSINSHKKIPYLFSPPAPAPVSVASSIYCLLLVYI